MSGNEGNCFVAPSPFENEQEMKNYKNEELKTFFTELLSHSKEELINFIDEEIVGFLANYTSLTHKFNSQTSVEDSRYLFNQFLDLKDINFDELKAHFNEDGVEESYKEIFYDLEMCRKENSLNN